MFIGLTANTTREQMTHAVLDSFGFGLRQLRDAIRGTSYTFFFVCNIFYNFVLIWWHLDDVILMMKMTLESKRV